MDTTDSPVSLVARWFIKPGCEADALSALEVLVKTIKESEPDTLAYFVHSPSRDPSLQSLPPADASTLLFFETYRSPKAFFDHVNGPVFKKFVSDYGDLFLQAHDNPYTTVQFLERKIGFLR